MAHTETPKLPERALPHLGTYTRDLPVTLERMFENALDWEHLPHLHAESFKAITCRSAGEWGWHCDAVLPNNAPVELELRLDRGHQRWITRTLSGLGAGSEIWSYVYAHKEGSLRVVVDFFVPDVPEEAREQMLAYYQQLYAGLYDEDVDMMTGRQAAIEARPAQQKQISLGLREGIEAKLPILFELGGRQFRLVEIDHKLIAHAAGCPHMLGPLGEAEVVDGAVTCPWHGYVFDVASGAERTGKNCKLATPPEISINEAGEVIVGSSRA